MFFKVLSKTVLMGGAGGAGGAVYLSNAVEIPNGLLNSSHKIKEESLPKKITKLEDIALYESFHGCKFGFIDSWPTTYNFERFLEKWKGTEWLQRVIKGADDFKKYCKDKKVVTLAFDKTVFKLKA